MAAPIPANPETWVAALQAQVVAKTGLPAERVVLTLQKSPPQAHPQEVVIRLGGFEAEGAYHVGSGRYAPLIARRVYVTIRTRYAVDAPESDAAFITDPTNGHFRLEGQVLDALLQFTPTDATGNALLQYPLHLVAGPDPEKAEGDDLGQTVLAFTAAYIPVLT